MTWTCADSASQMVQKTRFGCTCVVVAHFLGEGAGLRVLLHLFRIILVRILIEVQVNRHVIHTRSPRGLLEVSLFLLAVFNG